MPYIGTPAVDRFVSTKAASVFSGDGSTTAFTLDHAVGSDEDILVSVDGVIQEPSVAYAVSNGTTLTFTAAPSSNSGNNIFVYYLFRTVGTVGHPSNQALSATNVTIADAGNIGSASDTDAMAISSGGVVNFTQTPTLSDKRLTNTPAFKATLSANQTISNDTLTRVTFDTESYDTDNAFASNIFTVPSGQGGTYAFSYLLFVDDIDDADFCLSYIEVDGVQTLGTQDQRYGSSATQNQTLHSSGVLTLTAGQTVEVVVKHGEGANQELRNSHTYFQMHRLIGI